MPQKNPQKADFKIVKRDRTMKPQASPEVGIACFMQEGRSRSPILNVEPLVFGEIMLEADENALYDLRQFFG